MYGTIIFTDMDQDENHNSKLNVKAPESAGVPYLSKSKSLWGYQCPKLLWHAYNAKDKTPPPDGQTQAVFDQGHEVGSLANNMFPEGIEVFCDPATPHGLNEPRYMGFVVM